MNVLGMPCTIAGTRFEAGTSSEEIMEKTPCTEAWCAEALHRGILMPAATVTDDEPGGQEAPPSAAAAAIKLAEQNGIDLSSIDGTGRRGQITKHDVQRAIEARRATDEARALASEQGVNIDDITGTGPDGQVTVVDIESVLNSES